MEQEQTQPKKEQLEWFTIDDLHNVWDAAKAGKFIQNNATGKMVYEEKYPKFQDYFKDYRLSVEFYCKGKQQGHEICSKQCDECNPNVDFEDMLCNQNKK